MMDVALQSSVWVTSPEFAGYLQKRGFHWRKLWKQRWVALHGAEIVYMDKEPTADNASEMAITKAPITSATVIDRDDIDGHPHGFAVHVNDGASPTWYLRAENTREKKSWLMRLDHVHAIVRWLEDFEKVRVLGVGGTGIVYEILHKTNGQRYALKEMEIKNKAQMQMALAEAEMLKDIMENISHPNILHIEKVFQVGSKFYLVFPLCTGGELYDHVIRRGHFSEGDAAILCRDLVSGLHALHERDILHLDIKPENLLFESDREDAMIKITDFGLSKLTKYNNGDNSSNRASTTRNEHREPTGEELAAKLKAFSESGVLQRDKLRGTVGYMSPELILAGSTSKATDVWAAGVVLYILLCGRPPFQSKSNREILERSARGQYTMEGEEWESVSDEAKDLVRKMLVVDPKDRISTSDILNHPWLKVLESDGVSVSSEEINQSDSRPPVSGSNSKEVIRKTSGQHLEGALRRLSGFVTDRKVEKLATSVTRLVGTLTTDENGKKNPDLLTQFLHPDRAKEPAESTGGVLSALTSWSSSSSSSSTIKAAPVTAEEADSAPALQAMLNPDTRNKLVEAFTDVGCDGKLSIQQFLAVLNYLSFGIQNPNDPSGSGLGNIDDISPFVLSNSDGNDPQLGVPVLLFIRFIDRDGDGLISPDDIFAAHAHIIQMSACFVKVVFRLYVESIWYPGRQLNFLNLQRTIMSNNAGIKKKTGGGIKLSDEAVNIDIVEPPRFITARHVSAVFEKLGYDAGGGTKLFNILCEALIKKGQLGIGTGMAHVHDPDSDSDSDEDNNSDTTSNSLVGTFKSEEEEFNKLSGVTSNMDLNDIANASTLPTSTPIKAPKSSSTPSKVPSPPPPPGGGAAGYKMDVHDFIRAASIDPVFIKILLIKPKQRLSKMMRNLSMQSKNEEGGTVPAGGLSMKEGLQVALAQANLLSTSADNNRASSTGENTPGSRLSSTDRSSDGQFGFGKAFGKFARDLYGGGSAEDGEEGRKH